MPERRKERIRRTLGAGGSTRPGDNPPCPETGERYASIIITIRDRKTLGDPPGEIGFLAGDRGLTREAYTLDLRKFTSWCRARSLPPFLSVRRADIETFARDWRNADCP